MSRLPSGGAIDRSTTLTFSFDGKRYSGHPGDTLASALLANDVHLVGRSFKYHRPRGIYSSGVEEPNALVTIDRAGSSEPNTRATTVELYDGLVARSQNRWPSLAFDLMGVNGLLSPFIPAGFYYKTFMWPGRHWMFYERFIRRAAGMGAASRTADPSTYEHNHVFCDVLVVGGGPSGIEAAIEASRAAQRVVLIESDNALAQRIDLPNVQVMTRTTAFGYYDHNLVAALERVSDHLPAPAPGQPRQRMHLIRAGRVVLATGAIERPLVFENNDRPGVMLAGAVRTYLQRFAVACGQRTVIFTNNDDAYRTAIALHRAGIGVAAIVDSRTRAGGAMPTEARQLGMECLSGHVVSRALGQLRVNGVEVTATDGNGARRRIACDLLAISGGWTPSIHLHSQSGGRPIFDEKLSVFVPGQSKQKESSVGSATGAGLESMAAEPLWNVPGAQGKAFVDIQDDVTAADVALAHREGYVSVEHLKRYTTLGMGTDQGKTSNMNGLAIMASLAGETIARTGTTTFRPPFVPVAMGAYAGGERGLHYRPIRRTPMHDWHVAHGAQMFETGLWMRPRAYLRSGETLREAYIREATHIRNSVGVVDVSTLGKIDIQGPDALELIERAYCNNWRSLAVGRVRYGLMLREDGIIFDDGTCARLGEHRYFITTTTANAAKVLAHLEFHLQVVWPDLRAHVTSVTEQWATMALAGPKSRSVLGRVIEGGATGASNDALPHLAVAQTRVAGVPCRIFRMTYSGELAYEIAAPADRALSVWEAIFEAGRADDIRPYGTEAMGALRVEKGHVAGPELDGRTTADDLGLGALVSKTKKDFIGRRLSQRPALRDPNRAQLVGLMPVDKASGLRAGAQIIETSRPHGITPMIGHATSMTFSPMLGHDILLALVNGGRARAGQTVHAAYPLKDEIAAVRIVEPVFYDKEGARYRG